MELPLSALSRIGFGCHHASTGAHADALAHALHLGCNLIDTSSNYQGGRAEILVGSVLQQVKDKPVFVMTKGGSVSGVNLPYLQKLRSLDPSQIVQTGEQSFHCIHPDYLDAQLDVSRQRLQRDCIDGYLLHNPEYYLLNGTEPNHEEYYARLSNAFAYLEEQASCGKIRYYGISESSGLTDIQRLATIAAGLSSNHHFRLVQFPFNLVENRPGSGGNMAAVVKANGLVSLGNRPLTIRQNGKTYKLVKYTHRVSEASVLEAMDGAFSEIEAQIARRQLTMELTDVHIINYLYLQWRNLETDTFFADLYSMYFMPFVDDLFSGNILPDAARAFDELRTQLTSYIQRKMYRESRAFLAEHGYDNIFQSKHLARKVCRQYLSEGVDHVLIGMRDGKYVDEMAPLFRT